MTLYVSMTRNGGTVLSKYEGLDQGAANALCADLGATNITFLSEKQFSDIQTANQKPVSEIVVPQDIKDAKDVLKNKASAMNDKVDAIVKILGLDK